MITFDPDRLTARAAELELEMGAPGFWDEQQRAARISTEHSRLTKRLERYERLRGEYDDARELLAMDGDLDAELGEMLVPLRRELERLQEDALFNGEYDGGDAVVTVVGGTGGETRAIGPISPVFSSASACLSVVPSSRSVSAMASSIVSIASRWFCVVETCQPSSSFDQ